MPYASTQCVPAPKVMFQSKVRLVFIDHDDNMVGDNDDAVDDDNDDARHTPTQIQRTVD